ncbi:MAG: hypothetical protein LBP59_04180 [Planctomycetaceae bacterium]|nr:hypothetical protein [Planctomycetaceae bacterium]
MYSTANERGLTSQAPFCLPIGKVQARRPRSVGLACISGSQAVSPAKKGMQALKDRTRRRIAGVSPACGCTQPLMSEV